LGRILEYETSRGLSELAVTTIETVHGDGSRIRSDISTRKYANNSASQGLSNEYYCNPPDYTVHGYEAILLAQRSMLITLRATALPLLLQDEEY